MTEPPPQRICFRVDAAFWIGSGHVARCATLATLLRQRGAEIHFICRELPGNYSAWLEQSGFIVHPLSPALSPLPTNSGTTPPHSPWLGVTLEQEIAECRELLLAHPLFDWLIVDHYALDSTWETAMSGLSRRLMVIDDLADRPHRCAVLLDQNLQSRPDRYTALLPTDCRRLLGPSFAMLRPQFSELRHAHPAGTGEIHRLLIFMGGNDPENFTGRILAALDSSQLPPNLQIDVVIGAGNPHHRSISAACAKLPGTRLHVQTPQMAELMATADLMIGTPGTTTWERCCLGLPAVLLGIADNQRENGILVARRRAALYLGEASTASISRLQHLLPRLVKRPGLIKKMSVRAKTLVDGKGTVRAATLLLADLLHLRPAREDDCEAIWRWRNDPRTRRFAFNPASFPLSEHQRWYQGVLANENQQLLIGSVASQDIGVLRYDRLDSGWEISVYLDPDLLGLGLGSLLIAAGNSWLVDHLPPPHLIVARIRADNLASHLAFKKAGFLPGDEMLQWQPKAAVNPT